MVKYLYQKYLQQQVLSAKKGEIMARKTKKGKHRKTPKPKINKIKLILVAFVIIVVGFVLFKGIKATVEGVGKAKDNIGVLMTSIFGEGNDTSQINTEKQFDLEEEQNNNEKKYVVYIDAGRGGTDTGYKLDDGVTEKDINLEISKLVSSRLSSQGDISVIVSRNSDATISNRERMEDANKQNADVFVSIYMTGNEDSTAQGVQTFYRVDSSDASDQLATLVQKSIVAYVDLKDRGATEFTFDVLKENNMPAILIQCGFLSNPKEAKKLTNPEFQKELAEGISQGILSFLDAQG